MNELMKDKEGSISNYSKIPDMRFISVQLLSRVRLFVTPWTAAHQASLSITNSGSLLKLMSTKLKLMSTKSVIPSNHLVLCHSLSQHQSLF